MKKKIKKLQELTIKHNFMFCAVMTDPKACRPMLERTLGIEIAHIEVNKERSFMYNPEYKSIVLDIYAKDDHNTHYNVEMQTVRKKSLPRRARYYHSQMHMDILDTGCEYQELPNVYVIFICDFDPFGEGKYRYTCSMYCEETGKRIEDGCQTIFLSTVGKYPEEVPEELVRFLKFMHAGLEDSQKDWDDAYIHNLQERVARIKASRKMGGMYMHIMEVFGDEFLDELEDARVEARAAGLAEGRAEGRVEGRKEGQLEQLHSQIYRWLAKKGAVTDELKSRIEKEEDIQILEVWSVYAAVCASVEEFMRKIEEN